MNALAMAAFGLVVGLGVFLGTLFYGRYDDTLKALNESNQQIQELEKKLTRQEVEKQNLRVEFEKSLSELQTRVSEAADQLDAARREKDRIYHDISLRLNELSQQQRDALSRLAAEPAVQPREPAAQVREPESQTKLLMDKSELPPKPLPTPDKERGTLERQGNKPQ